jgi:hypothetical protein
MTQTAEEGQDCLTQITEVTERDRRFISRPVALLLRGRRGKAREERVIFFAWNG